LFSPVSDALSAQFPGSSSSSAASDEADPRHTAAICWTTAPALTHTRLFVCLFVCLTIYVCNIRYFVVLIWMLVSPWNKNEKKKLLIAQF